MRGARPPPRAGIIESFGNSLVRRDDAGEHSGGYPQRAGPNGRDGRACRPRSAPQRARDVLSKWVEAAGSASGETGHLWHEATTMRNHVEEELARVAFEMDVLYAHNLHRSGERFSERPAPSDE